MQLSAPLSARRTLVQDRFFRLFLFVFLTIAPIGAALAQSAIVGQLAGAGADANGAAVAGAPVAVANEATGLRRTVTANDAGFYVVTNLPPGVYTVTAERQGFKKSVRVGNNLIADGRLTVDFTLEAGEVSETVEVVSQVGEAVNTTSGEVARVVDAQQAQDLALNGRNYIQLTTLIPGAA